jgi:hypothetical protein
MTCTLHEDWDSLMIIIHSFVLRMRNISDKKLYRKSRHTFMFNTLFRKSFRLWHNVEKYCRAGQATDDGACAIHAGYLRVDCVWNVMAHAQKPDLVFRRNGRVHLNRRGRQFSRLLAAEVCASAVVMLDTPCSEVAWEYGLPIPFASFPVTSPPVRHRVPSGFNWTLKIHTQNM